MNIQVTKEASFKDKYNNNESSMNSKIEDDKENDCSSVNKKRGKRPSEGTDESKKKKNNSSEVSELRYLYQNSLQDNNIGQY